MKMRNWEISKHYSYTSAQDHVTGASCLLLESKSLSSWDIYTLLMGIHISIVIVDTDLMVSEQI